jgi:di/tricarboxylate transporter
MQTPIYKSLVLWTLITGILAFVAKWFFPAFPLDQAGILLVVLFLLGLFGVVPSARALGFSSIFSSLAFYEMLVGLAGFIIHYYVPEFPLDNGMILMIVLFVVGLFGIRPELRARGLLR